MDASWFHEVHQSEVGGMGTQSWSQLLEYHLAAEEVKPTQTHLSAESAVPTHLAAELALVACLWQLAPLWPSVGPK